jgi:hypothetical protein
MGMGGGWFVNVITASTLVCCDLFWVVRLQSELIVGFVAGEITSTKGESSETKKNKYKKDNSNIKNNNIKIFK